MNHLQLTGHVLTALKLVLSSALVLSVGFAVYGAGEARALEIRTDTVAPGAGAGGLDGLRVVFLADVHAGPIFGTQRMDALVKRVNALEPDVLILGGDYVGGRANGSRIFYPAAARFEARLAKIAVLGNHDVWENGADARRLLEQAGFTVLENENTTLQVGGAELAVAGVEDFETGDADPVRAAQGLPDDAFSILVSHNPDVFAERLGETAGTWDLALAGHTHAGQVTFFGNGTPLMPSAYGERYRSGWRTEHGTPILVTSGVGAVTVPVRLFAPPEVNVITLRGK